jgi:type I restriction enzyme S subunit
MKEGWVIKKLGDVCFSKSSNVSQNQLADQDGDYPIFGASGLIKNVSFYHRDTPYLSIVKDGSGFGRVTKMNAYTSVIGTLQYILPTDGIDLDYLYYSVISIDFKKYVSGAAIPHIYFKDYKNEPFLWMPLPEQQRIVAILDDAFAKTEKAKANAEQNLKNAKELFESYLQGVFEKKGDDWEEKRFDEICILQRGFDLPTHSRKEGIFPLVSSNGITDRIDLWKVKAPGVVTGRSGTIGNVHFIEEDYWPLNTALYIKEFFGNNERCVYYFLKQFDLSKYSSGAGVPTLNRNNVHGELVCFPKSIKEQKEIVQKLDALTDEVKKLEAIYVQKIKDLVELKKSVLQKAFSGEF